MRDESDLKSDLGTPLRTGPLCWGQHMFWLLDSPHFYGNRAQRVAKRTLQVPPGMSVDTFRACLYRLCQRHEALRTLYSEGEDGVPAQTVYSGLKPKLLVVVLEGEQLHAPHKALHASLEDFLDIRHESSLRAAVSAVGDEVGHAVFQVHEIAFDGGAVALLTAEFDALLQAAATGEPLDSGPASWHPIDQAMLECAPSTSVFKERALRYWESVLVSSPHSTIPFRWDNDTPILKTSISSRRLAAACQAGAMKYHCSLHMLIETLVAIVIVGWTGHDACVLDTVVSNRWTDKTKNSMGRYAATLKIHLDYGGDPRVSEMVERTQTALLTAYRYGWHDEGELRMRAARASSATGAHPAAAIYFDCRNYLTPSSCHVGADDVPVQTRFEAGPPNLFVDVRPFEGSIRLELTAPTATLSEVGARAFVDHLLSLADEVLHDADPRLSELASRDDIPRPWSGTQWISINKAWINLHDTAELLRQHDGVRFAALFPVCEGERLTIVAYVVSRDPMLEEAALRAHMREAASHCPATMVPHRYVLCDRAPQDIADRAAWQERSRGNSRDDGSVPSFLRAPPHAEALVSAFSACHSQQRPQMNSSYAEAGGKFVCIPAVLDRIARAGLSGVTFGDLLGMAPLGQLAAKLRPIQRDGTDA